MAMLGAWMRSSVATYLDNPTSRRDYRAQLRGSRSIVLWSVYLIALIGIGMLTYAESVSQGRVSIVQAQESLQEFYALVMGLLAGMVVLVAPALAATAIVIEKERRSLDLVFSAPVKPKTLLVGKMISSYRYTWMLLVLSLPVTAVCVVLGGATWGEVLSSYALLSLHALVYSAIALTISALANKPVSALVWTYIAIGVYSAFAGGIAGASSIRTFISGSGSMEAPFTVTLTPFTVMYVASTHTTLFGVAVPNWILFGVYALFISRLLLLGAASALSPYNSWETKNFRLSMIAASGLFGFLLSYVYLSTVGPMTISSASPSAWTNSDLICGDILAIAPMFLLIGLPFITCSGSDGEKKFWANGLFSIKEMFRGTPAGGLPFLLGLVLMTGVGVYIADLVMVANKPGPIFYSSLVWAVGFWTFAWSLGRLASAISFELKSARTLHLAALIVLLGLPVPFLSIVDSEQQTPLWSFYPLYPLWTQSDDPSFARMTMGIALFVIGGVVVLAANRKLKAKLAVPPVVA